MKICRVCGTELPLEGFSRRASSPDGRGNICKPCDRARAREWTRKNPERVKAAKARWHAENREAQNAHAVQYRKEHLARIRKQVREWQDANREYTREKSREYYYANREVVLAKKREYREANKAAIQQRERNWYERKPEYYVAKSHKRRALAAEMRAEDQHYIAILRNDPCAYCGGAAGAIDHIDPLHRAGTSDWQNLTAACGSCNSSKRTASLLQFLRRA